MGISDFVDERDRRPVDPMATGTRPGFTRRWVRTKGYDAEGHMSRMKELGYEPVERSTGSAPANAPELTSGQHSQLDNTYKRGDTMLMECPNERVDARQREQQALTKRRTQAATAKVPHEDEAPQKRRRRE
jgi:hypothetical protein